MKYYPTKKSRTVIDTVLNRATSRISKARQGLHHHHPLHLSRSTRCFKSLDPTLIQAPSFSYRQCSTILSPVVSVCSGAFPRLVKLPKFEWENFLDLVVVPGQDVKSPVFVHSTVIDGACLPFCLQHLEVVCVLQDSRLRQGAGAPCLRKTLVRCAIIVLFGPTGRAAVFTSDDPTPTF
jgi:hypothetical protein